MIGVRRSAPAAAKPRDRNRFLLSPYLNLVRFLAALAVVFGHARLQSFGQNGPDRSSSFLLLGLYHMGDFAHLAVIVFFVISGYLVGGKLYFAGRPGFASKYLIDRASRIYTVMVPVMLFGFATMIIQQQLWGQAFKLQGQMCNGTFDDFAESLLFLHQGVTGARSPCFNTPFWSLIYEVFYYLFFLAVALAVTAGTRRTRLTAAAGAVALCAYGLLEGGNLYPYSTIWLLGMAAAHPHPFRGRQLLVTLLMVGLLVLQAAFRLDDPNTKWEVPASLLMVGSILLLRRWQPFEFPQRVDRLLALGAAMSYSLYLAHAPAMNLLRGFAEGGLGVRLAIPAPPQFSLLWFIGFVVSGFAAGFACWALFERHTMAIRSSLERRLGVARPEAHQPVPANMQVEDRPVLPPRSATQVPDDSKL